MLLMQVRALMPGEALMVINVTITVATEAAGWSIDRALRCAANIKLATPVLLTAAPDSDHTTKLSAVSASHG
jgi:hypothetical protein